MALLDVHLRARLRAYALDVALTIGPETVALVGPSGAGKTTVLRTIAGLRGADGGHVRLDGTPWLDTAARVDLPPERRSVGLVFQEYALFPHMTVAANVAFAHGDDPATMLARFGVGHLADARPGTLSGGERQRVALARALARDPQVLLLDEPLAALDTHTRATVRDELDALLGDLGIPTLLVTHDFRDAAVLADRVAVIVDGRIRQTGTAAELVSAPADAFVASFTGATVVRGVATPDGRGGARVALDDGGVLTAATAAAGRVSVAVHPWDVRVTTDPPRPGDGGGVIAGSAGRLVPEGGRVRVRVGCLVAELEADAAAALGGAAGAGETLYATVAPERVRLFAHDPAAVATPARTVTDPSGGRPAFAARRPGEPA
ncbi:ABC transporter ATP-binding protein [Paraconexibacter antarcticus]|uniref:ABC transporter ATP-binding protein n=1 Tax=Paraconexibacter antarcticus TaxID=2949664 RepID=A0ABY5DPG6_9ACTN|nr:ABC transporter ATP-binding protein [Paraconexibacter antarcticus]UTI62804.1 ABC transporter ATP-binding protein [Paraconexibacter antarcticus]